MFFNFCRRIFEGFISTGLEYGTIGLHLSPISTFHELAACQLENKTLFVSYW